MAHLGTIFNHAFCAALRPLYCCESTIVAHPSKPSAQYVRVRKRSAAPEAIYQLVEKADDHHGRKVELYKKINDTALSKRGGELKEHIVVTRRQHRKQIHNMDEKGAMIEQDVKECKGPTKHRRRPAKAASNDPNVATPTVTESKGSCRVDSVAPATINEDRSALPAHVKPLRCHQGPISHTSDRSVHATNPHDRQLMRPKVHHRTSKLKRSSPRQPASAVSNEDAAFDDRDLMSLQSRSRDDTPPQCTIEMTHANYVEKTISARAQETWISPFQQPQMGLPQSRHLVFGEDDPTVSRSCLVESDEMQV